MDWLLSRCARSCLILALSVGTAAGAAAQIEFKSNLQCSGNNAVYVGRSTKGYFKGSWADYIKAVGVNPSSDVTATVSNPVANFANSRSDVVFHVSSGADWLHYDERAVSIRVEPPLQAGYWQDKGDIHFVEPAQVTSTSVPRGDYYETVDLTLNGDNLQPVNIVTASARVDASHPVVAYAGEMPRLTDGAMIPAAVLSATGHAVVVRLSLPQKLTAVTADIKLGSNNADPCTHFGTVPGSGPSPMVARRVTMGVPAAPALPYVQSIDVLNAIVGRDATFTITLNKPVSRPAAAMYVYWKLVPGPSFTRAGSTAPYDFNGANRVLIQMGQSAATFKMHVAALPPGAINVGTVYLQTWIGDTTRNTPPYFFQKEFTITNGNR